MWKVSPSGVPCLSLHEPRTTPAPRHSRTTASLLDRPPSQPAPGSNQCMEPCFQHHREVRSTTDCWHLIPNRESIWWKKRRDLAGSQSGVNNAGLATKIQPIPPDSFSEWYYFNSERRSSIKKLRTFLFLLVSASREEVNTRVAACKSTLRKKKSDSLGTRQQNSFPK